MSMSDAVFLVLVVVGIPLAAWAGVRVLRDPHRDD